ncbi:TPR-like protein [Byssothecium circinans]|uniref:TPR-like protein n=1 Tax=Byssothecium circinans TaxID=147558 RepID=A0A6A5U4W5_9PLEO|nr:TPR-like protein [Byssothecium circinans]
MGALKVDSELLENIHEEFVKIVLRVETIKIHSFQEARGITGLKGFHGKVVDDFSSKLGLAEPKEIVERINANHMEIARYGSREDEGYLAISAILRKFIREEREQQLSSAHAATVAPQEQSGLMPFSMVPFQRDRAFVGRDDILADLRTKFEEEAPQDHARVALIGLGGIGKSQIAIEYAYRVRDFAPQTWVFWVYAGTADRIKEAYKNIAARLELRGWDDPKTDILQLVYNWLCDERNGRWLMIIDNADDDRVISGPTYPDNNVRGLGAPTEKMPMDSYIPQSSNGWILVTSRNQLAATNLVGIPQAVLQVEQMGEKDALILLKNKVTVDKASEDDAKTLVRELDYIPIAITHAAAYIGSMAPMITVSKYLEFFQESEENQTYLLNSEAARDLRRDETVSDAAITTWQISFEQIRKSRPDAADLLSLMAVFDRQGIPDPIVRNGRDSIRFMEAVGALTHFSLIKVQNTKQSEQQYGEYLFDMHGLVQLATRKWLEVQNQLDGWKTVSLRIMATNFPLSRYETRSLCQILYPHANRLLTYSPRDNEATLSRSIVALSVAEFLRLEGVDVEAERICRDAITARSNLLGRGNPATLDSMHTLTNILLDRGQYTEAQSVQRQVLEGFEKLYPQGSCHILRACVTLGVVLHRLRMSPEAEKVTRRAVQGLTEFLGPEHREVLASLSSLGLILHRQGKHEDADKILQKVMDAHERRLGVEHTETISSISNICSSFCYQKKWAQAEELWRRNLERSKKAHRPEHPSTLNIMCNIGRVMRSQGKDAEAIFRDTLRIRERVLGPNHFDTLVSASFVGLVSWDQHKYDEAEEIFIRTIKGFWKNFGPECLETHKSIKCFAWFLREQGKDGQLVTLKQLLEHPEMYDNDSKVSLLLDSIAS